MSTYSARISERMERANTLREARNQRYAYNAYLKQKEEEEKAETIARLQAEEEAKRRQNAGFFERFFATLGDFWGNVITGLSTGLEGIYDAGASIVGAIGGIFDKDFQDRVKDHIAYDWTAENIGNPIQQATSLSYLNDGWLGEVIEGAAHGIGQFLPAVALSAIPGAGPALAMTYTIGSAAGNSIQEAFQDPDTNYYRGLLYGAGTGAVEGITEKMFGGFAKGIYGKGYLDDVIKNTTKGKVAKLATNFLKEGAEEMTAELVNPLMQNIYKDKGFFEGFLTEEHVGNIVKAGAEGALAAGAAGWVAGRFHPKATKIKEDLTDLEGVDRKEENLWANDKLDEKAVRKISEARTVLLEDISKNLKESNERVRADLITKLEQYGLTDTFDTDGTIIDNAKTQAFLNKPASVITGPVIDANGNVAEQPQVNKTIKAYNAQAYTPSLRGKEASLLYKPTTKELTEAQVAARKSFSALNKGQIKSNFVITDQSLGVDENGKKINSVFADGTLYISSKANASKVLTEFEMTKTLEGTKAYQNYVKFILKEISTNKALKEKYGDIDAKYEELVNKYTQQLLSKSINASSKKLSKEATGVIENIATQEMIREITAKFTSDNLLSNEAFINKLAHNEPGVLKRLASWLKGKYQVLSKGNAEEVATAQIVAKAQRLYNRALERSFGVPVVDKAAKKIYNNLEKEVENGKQRNNGNDESGKRADSENTTQQTRSVQGEPKESGQKENGRVREEIERKYGYEEKVIRNTKIKAVKTKLDYTNDELKIYNQNKKLGLDTVFYKDSALPLNMQEEVGDAGFNGFADASGKTIYLRSDSTISEDEIKVNNEHERLHYIISEAKEEYNALRDSIFEQMTNESKDALTDEYKEAYYEVYSQDMEKVNEEIIVDIVVGRVKANFENVEAVNSAISKFFKAYEEISKQQLDTPKITNKDVRFSVAHDSDGTPLSAAQNKFFKDSQVRDANGNLKVMYHGTPRGTFNVFNTEYEGAYFTDNREYAKEYTRAAEFGENDKIYACYLNIKKLFDTRKPEDKKLYNDKFYMQWGNGTPLSDKGLPDWTDGSDLVEFVKQYGYDGFVVDEGGYPLPNGKTKDRGISYVALYSNQIKAIDNVNPTKNDDIRYVINKNKDIKNLVAVHNISSRKLLEAIKLGGFPVPSIAITKTDFDYTNFGDITLVFRKDTIDPYNPQNKVYASDVYSKRFPHTINKFKDEAASELADKFADSAKLLEEGISGFNQYFEDASISAVVSTLSSKDYVRFQFLKDSGVDIEPVYKKYEVDEQNAEIYEMLIDKFKPLIEGSKPLDDYSFEDIRKEVIKTYKDAYYKLADKIKDGWVKRGYKRMADEAEDNMPFGKVDNFIVQAREYYKKKDKKVLDSWATYEKIKEAIKGKENKLEQYLEDLITPYSEGEYYRNDLEYYDRYGYPRDFDELYEEVNIQNILEYMRGTVQNGEGFDYGVGNLRGLLAKQYSSIEEIRFDEDKIVSPEEMEKLKSTSSEIYYNLALKLSDEASIGGEILQEIAKTNRSNSAIRRICNEYRDARNISDETIEEIQTFMDNLAEYPTEYFEAKPQRIVNFEEVVEVVAPKDTDKRITKFFKNKNIKVSLYSGDKGRKEVIKALPDDIRFTISQGQASKERAKGTRGKVYNREEAELAINNVVSAIAENSEFTAILKGKNKKQVVDKLWNALNTDTEGYRSTKAFEIADFILNKAAIESYYDEETIAREEAINVIDALSGYIHKLDLTGIKGEIDNRYEKNSGAYKRWSAGKQGGMNIMDMAAELREQGIITDDSINNDADKFFEINEMYVNAQETMKKKTTKLLQDLASDNQVAEIRQKMVKEILQSFDKYGTPTKLKQVIDKYSYRVNQLKAEVADAKIRNKAINNLFETIDRVKGLEKYKSAAIELAPEVSAFIKELGKIKTWRGNLASNVRDIIRSYKQVSDNTAGKKLYELISGEQMEGLTNPVISYIDNIADGKGELTTNELLQLDAVLRAFIHNVRNYDKVFFEGRNQSETELARQGIAETNETVKVADSGLGGKINSLTHWLQAPVWRFERLSSYRKTGVMSKVFNELREGETKKSDFSMRVALHFRDFFKANKKEVKTWNKDEIDIGGIKMTKGQMITLYMLNQREQARGHLFSQDYGTSGTIRLTNEKRASKGKMRQAFNEGKDVGITQETLLEIESKLTEKDKEFIKLAHEFFDDIARNAKKETDEALFGISNVGEDNYIPIRVADDQIYKQLGSDRVDFADLFTVYNPSFNQDTKRNANNKIVVENIIDIINRHTNQMAAYYGYAIPMRSFNRIYNKKLEDGSTLRNSINKVDSTFENYVGKLFADMQGNRRQKDGFAYLMDKMRGFGAKAALGCNLKVLANQLVSLPAAAANGVQYKYIVKGFSKAISGKTNFDILTKYAPMLFDRFREGNNIDVGLLREDKTALSKIDRLGDLATRPIGLMDKFVCGAVWNACLEQTKNSTRYKPYSDEHYKVAAKLTEDTVIRTQANYKALYRPEILRSQDSFLQFSTMFMSEPLQQFSLLTSSIDKIKLARARLKQGLGDRTENLTLYATAKREATRALSAIFIDTIILTMITELFKWVKGQDDDDEDKLKSILIDFAGNYVGMIPFARDIANFFLGYDITNTAYTGLTNLLNALQDCGSAFMEIVSTGGLDDKKIHSILRKLIISGTQLFGVPLRNIETYFKGITEKFAPAFVYRYEKFFYDGTTSSYMAELNTAINSGNDKMADAIIDEFMKDEKIPVSNKALRTEYKVLYAEGYSVFPKTIGDTITHNGEDINLTKAQKKQFKAIYSEANDKLSELIKSAIYQTSDYAVRAKAIKNVYDYYYNLALEDLLGEQTMTDKQRLFFAAFGVTDTIVGYYGAQALTSDKDKKGNTINGSRKTKVQKYVSELKLTAAQKYILMGYLGYKNTLGEFKVKSYIQSLKLSRADKKLLLQYSGYDVK